MWFDANHRARSWVMAGLAAALLCGPSLGAALAQDRGESSQQRHSYAATGTSHSARPDHRAPRRDVEPRAGQYFVEFRSRYALSYGHTFLVHGRLNAKGEVGQVTADQVAGLHPAGDGPQLWSVGHVVPVPAETGPSDGDMEDQYISNRFRVVMDEARYRRVASYIRRKQRTPTMWHAVLYNCNRWVGEVAEFMGMDAPTNTLLYPADYITSLRQMNSGKAAAEPEFSAHRDP